MLVWEKKKEKTGRDRKKIKGHPESAFRDPTNWSERASLSWSKGREM